MKQPSRWAIAVALSLAVVVTGVLAAPSGSMRPGTVLADDALVQGVVFLPLVANVAPPTTCSPCYPDVCIPPPPPDLNCDDIPYSKFRVVGCDPHGFDYDGDGIGCEGGW